MKSFTNEKKRNTVAVEDQSIGNSQHPGQLPCNNCGVNAMCRRRPFSEQAWTVLLLWNEISPDCVDKPICQECYDEMRDILIDRANEVELAFAQDEKKIAKIRKKLAKLAS